MFWFGSDYSLTGILVRILDCIVAVIGGDHSAAVFHVNHEELERHPALAPKVVVGDHFVSSSADKEVVDENTEEEVNEQQREEDDEESVEESMVSWRLVDLLAARFGTEHCQVLK